MFSGTNKHSVCVDGASGKNANNQPVKVWPCHNLGGNQVLSYNKSYPFTLCDNNV